ncbi:MAG TPA: LamG domain-containing protein, partial [Phycisphaerae bacterium]|nr:LamG domain-containing protein [Phycisphaerae bacterium]
MSGHTSPKVLGTLVIAMALAVSLTPAARATNYTWERNLATREWDAMYEGKYGNWNPSTAVPTTGDTVIFSSDAPPAIGDVLLNGDRDVDTVRLANPSGTYTLKGPAYILSAATIEQKAAAVAAVNEIQAAVEGTGGAGGNELNLAVEAGSLTLSGQVAGLMLPTAYNAMVAAGASLELSNIEAATPNWTAGNIQVSGTLTVHGANNSALGDTNVTLQGGTLALQGATVPAAPSTDVELYWGFNEGAGGTAGDGSVNGRTGTVNNALWVGSQAGYGGALDFNGTDSQVGLNGDVSFLNGLSQLTVAMWIQSDGTMQDRGFWEMRDSGTSDEWGGRYDSDGGQNDYDVMKFAITTNNSPDANEAADSYESAANVQTTAWQHVAMTWQDGTGFKLYIDGVLDTATEPMSRTTGVTAMVNRFTVGDGCKNPWDGRIDEVYIYSRALDSGEINTVMTSPGLFTAMGVQMAGTVTVFGDSTINVDGESATVGGLQPEAGSTLHVTGTAPLAADATTFTGGAVTLDTQVETRLGRLSDHLVTSTTVSKTGAADLVFDQTDWANDGDNTTVQIDEGRVVVAGDTFGFDPLGGAAVEINTGAESLVFSSKFGNY